MSINKKGQYMNDFKCNHPPMTYIPTTNTDFEKAKTDTIRDLLSVSTDLTGEKKNNIEKLIKNINELTLNTALTFADFDAMIKERKEYLIYRSTIDFLVTVANCDKNPNIFNEAKI